MVEFYQEMNQWRHSSMHLHSLNSYIKHCFPLAFFNGKITVRKINSIFLWFCWYGLYNNNKKPNIWFLFSTRLSVLHTIRTLLIYSHSVKRRQIAKHLQYNKKNSHTILYCILLMIQSFQKYYYYSFIRLLPSWDNGHN